MAQMTGPPTQSDKLHARAKPSPTLLPAAFGLFPQTQRQPEIPGGSGNIEFPWWGGPRSHSFQAFQLNGGAGRLGQGTGMVRKILETGYTGSAGPRSNEPPFRCQHFPTGAKSEELFPLKIRKALKFPYIEDRALRFLAGLQLPLPPSLNSCFHLISK